MERTTKLGKFFKKSKPLLCLFFAVLLLAGSLPGSIWGERSSAAAESEDVSDYITWSDGILEVDKDDEWVEIEADSKSEFLYGNYRFTISWEADSERSYHAGEHFTFTVPMEFADMELDMLVEGETVLGTIHIDEEGNGTATFTEAVEELAELSGKISFEGTHSESEGEMEVKWKFIFSHDVSYTYMGRNETNTESKNEKETDSENSDTSTDSDVEAEKDSDDSDANTESETNSNSSTTPPKLSRDAIDGPDKSAEFEIDYLKITVGGKVVNQNTDIIDVHGNPKVDIFIKWAQTTMYDNFGAGDYFSLKILEVSGNSNASWGNLTQKVPLICEHGDTLGTASLVGERIDGDTIALYLKVVFTAEIAEKTYIAGDFTGSANLMGLKEGDFVTFNTTGESETALDWGVNIIANPNAGKGSLGGKTTDSKSYKGTAAGYNPATNEIRWRIHVRDLIYESFKEHKAGNIPDYKNLILEDTLDMHQTFAARYSPNNTSGNFEIRMPLYLYDSKDDRVISDPLNDGSFYFSGNTWTNSKEFMNAMTEITADSNLTDPSDSGVVYTTPEDYVRNVPRTFTIVTEEDPDNPGYERERLVMNLGAPGSTGLRYGEVMTGGVNGAETQYGSFAYVFNRLERSLNICRAVVNDLDNQDALTNSDPSIQEVLDKTTITYTYVNPTNSNDKATYEYTWGEWKKWLQVYEDSYHYYNIKDENGKLVGPYIYAFELDVITNIRRDQLETLKLQGTVKNSFAISGGFKEQGGSSTETNKWGANISAVIPEKGDVQIFKADSLYGYEEGKMDSAIAVTGAMKNVEFEVYQADGTGPLSFDYSGKYIYKSDGSGKHTTVETVYSNGSLVLSGLPDGTYYLKEVSELAGYYTGHSVKFTVDKQTLGYQLVNNYRRGVSLTKVDADKEEKILPGATFELYQYTKDDFSDTKKVTGFTKTTIEDKDGNKADYLVYDGKGTATLTTGNDGTLNIVNLPAGNYYLKEVTAPDGYRVSDEKYKFILTEELKEGADAIYDLGNITNKVYKTDFSFTKVDELKREVALPGAEFRLYYEDGAKTKYYYSGKDENGDAKWVSEDEVIAGDTIIVTSGDDGKVNFEGLKTGDYILEEIKAPVNYLPPTGYWEITVGVKNGNVVIDTNPVPAVKDGEEPPSFEEHNSSLGNVPADIKTVDFTFMKVDAANYDEQNPLPGAEFTLYKYTGEGLPEDDELVTLGNDGKPTGNWEEADTSTTGELEGEGVSIYLESGIYQLVETKAPEGYQLPIGQWRFVVDADAGTISNFESIPGSGATAPPAVKEGEEHTGDNPMYLIGNMKSYTLPIAGGNGVYWFIALGLLSLAVGLIRIRYMYSSK